VDRESFGRFGVVLKTTRGHTCDLREDFPVRLSERTSTLDIEKDDADLKPYQDFLSFIDAIHVTPARVSEDAEAQTSSVSSMSERMDAFLLKYPKSPKREAATCQMGCLDNPRIVGAHGGYFTAPLALGVL